MKYIFILNPTAASGNAIKLSAKIKDYCIKYKLDYELILTQHEKHATEIASKYNINDNICLFSIGGDGTAHEILNGINDKVPFSIIPAGTGNDFFRMIHHDNSDIMSIITDSINGRLVSVDYGIANSRRFLNSTTIGLDARVNTMVQDIYNNYKIPKKLSYGISAFTSIFKPDTFKARLEFDGQVIEKEVLLIGVMNGRFYGNGVSPVSRADIQDGYFDIILIDSINTLKLLPLLPKYMKGKTENIKQIHLYKAKNIKITTNKPVYAQSDGENFKSDSMTFDIMEKGLILKVPAYSKLK